MIKVFFNSAILFLPFSIFGQDLPSDNVVCNCTTYHEFDNSRTYENKYTVPLKEVTAVPPLSETWVNYLSDYELEKDSSGRVNKMIRTNYGEGTEEITYLYNSNNQLIQENIHMENSQSGNYVYREEKIYYSYDDLGRRNSKIKKVVNANDESVIEECHYLYTTKE